MAPPVSFGRSATYLQPIEALQLLRYKPTDSAIVAAVSDRHRLDIGPVGFPAAKGTIVWVPQSGHLPVVSARTRPF
jgi:hypothetical protein